DVIFDELHKILAKNVNLTVYNTLIALKLYTYLSTASIFLSIRLTILLLVLLCGYTPFIGFLDSFIDRFNRYLGK
ncbi:MAG TPA: hypothetical protein VFM99_08265, partial [Chitinophagales bacterium]|nr:hypothetical protein [Chitinophagales bacterium]